MMLAAITPPARCDVCGNASFEHTAVLWPALVSAWGLSRDEAAYIDAQQGMHCTTCGSNLRSIALAVALMRARGFTGLLTDFVRAGQPPSWRVLELNEAGTLHPLLAMLPGHRLASYPDVDMTQLPFDDGSYDAVVHSDTLEHVPGPGRALAECRRVLADGGILVFTVPVVMGRLSRSRAGLPPSYHGSEGTTDPSLLVQTEFGADVWTTVLGAGFSSCEFVPYGFPAGLAIIARR